MNRRRIITAHLFCRSVVGKAGWPVLSAIVLLLLSHAVLAGPSGALTNQLKDHPSPYLEMHAEDPVAWQPWNKEVLARAAKENKMLFVSIGYFACHWCHVMQRESFKDEAVAKYLNQNFIPVKIDRELNPALDAYLIEFVQRTRGHAGWPLNVFITPEGDPVIGLVYMQKERFRTLMKQVQGLWSNKNAYMREMAAQAAAQQKGEKLKPGKLEKDLWKKYQAKFLQQGMSIADEMQGGFGDQNKFPMVDQLRFMTELYKINKMEQLGQFLQITLDQMATQGLRDHIGGGFYRYTVDPDWQTPHYEKMLYDNAGLAVLYLEAADAMGRKDYLAIARETLDFMIRELLTKEGGMVASLSAIDDANVEGGYYLWDKETLLGILSEQEYDIVYELWKMEDASESGEGYLPRQVISPDDVAKRLGMETDAVMRSLVQAQSKLFEVRKKRKLPVDTKQLASWNGLALYALTQGAALERGEKYQQAAMQVRNYLVKKLWTGQRLARALGKHGAIGQAGLEDYAYAAHGLYAWARHTGYMKDVELVKRWLDIAWQRFYTPTGWVLNDEMLIQSELGTPIVDDGPMPSPSSILISTSLAVAELTDDKQLRERVAGALGLGHGLLDERPFYHASHIAALSQFQAQQQINSK